MAAANTDLLKKVGLPGSATTLASPGHTIGGTSINVDSTTNWPTDTGVTFAMDTVTLVNGVETRDTGSYTVWTGVVASATSISNMVLEYGTDQNYSAGSATRVYIIPNTTRENDLVDWGLAEHAQDGTHTAITATTIAASSTVSGTVVTGTAIDGLKDNSVALSTYRANTIFDHVISGGVWTGDSYASTLAASMTAMVCMINGRRISIGAVTARAFTASKDVYIDVLDNADGTGTLVYTDNTINAASPALAANSIRIGIIVTGASAIASVAKINQGQETMIVPIASSIPYQVTDSLGNLICPRDPSRRVLGYRQIISTFGPVSTAVSDTDVTGLSVPVIVPANRKVKVTFAVPGYEQTGGIDTIYGAIKVKESTTVLSNIAISPNAANIPDSGQSVAILTPSAGLHTYKAAVANNGAGPNFSVDAASTGPAFIMVELV